MLPIQFLIAAMVITGVATVIDWKTGLIPNWLTLGPLAAAPLLHAVLGLREGGAASAGDRKSVV